MAGSRKKNVSKNIIVSFILQFTKIAVTFLSRIIFVKILGASYLGVNGLFSNILGILSLADLGMTTVLMYSLYKPLANDDKETISKYMNYFKNVYNIIALIVTVFGILLIPFLKYLVNLPEQMQNIYLYYFLLLINTALTYIFVYKTTLVAADQKMYMLNKFDIFFQIMLFILQVVVLILTKSFTLYLLSNVIVTLLSNIVKVFITEKMYPYLKENKDLSLDKNEKRNIMNNLKSLFLYKIGTVIQSNTDNIFISIFSGTIAVGLYSNYVTIINSIVTFISMVFSSMKASIGNFVVEKDKEKQLEIFDLLETYNYWIICFCSVCFLILIPSFIKICFGKEYVLSNFILIVSILNFYTSNIRQNIWAYRETTGLFNKTRYITIVTSILNIIFSIIFGKLFGIGGVILATVFARMIYAWWKEPMILFGDYFKTGTTTYYIVYFKRLLLCVIISIVTYVLCENINVSSILMEFIIRIILCCVIVPLIIYIIYRKTYAFKNIKNIIVDIKKGEKNAR